jgi:hypothetical protein
MGSGARLAIELRAREVARGGTLDGAVTLSGGRAGARVVVLELKLETIAPSVPRPTIGRVVPLAGAFDWKDGAPVSFPFRLSIPADAPATDAGFAHRAVALACLRGEGDVVAWAPIVVRDAVVPATRAIPVVTPIELPGRAVLAQWIDGKWYPARAVATKGDRVRVEWNDRRLGQSSWLDPDSVR